MVPEQCDDVDSEHHSNNPHPHPHHLQQHETKVKTHLKQFQQQRCDEHELLLDDHGHTDAAGEQQRAQLAVSQASSAASAVAEEQHRRLGFSGRVDEDGQQHLHFGGADEDTAVVPSSPINAPERYCTVVCSTDTSVVDRGLIRLAPPARLSPLLLTSGTPDFHTLHHQRRHQRPRARHWHFVDEPVQDQCSSADNSSTDTPYIQYSTAAAAAAGTSMDEDEFARHQQQQHFEGDGAVEHDFGLDAASPLEMEVYDRLRRQSLRMLNSQLDDSLHKPVVIGNALHILETVNPRPLLDGQLLTFSHPEPTEPMQHNEDSPGLDMASADDNQLAPHPPLVCEMVDDDDDDETQQGEQDMQEQSHLTADLPVAQSWAGDSESADAALATATAAVVAATCPSSIEPSQLSDDDEFDQDYNQALAAHADDNDDSQAGDSLLPSSLLVQRRQLQFAGASRKRKADSSEDDIVLGNTPQQQQKQQQDAAEPSKPPTHLSSPTKLSIAAANKMQEETAHVDAEKDGKHPDSPSTPAGAAEEIHAMLATAAATAVQQQQQRSQPRKRQRI